MTPVLNIAWLCVFVFCAVSLFSLASISGNSVLPSLSFFLSTHAREYRVTFFFCRSTVVITHTLVNRASCCTSACLYRRSLWRRDHQRRNKEGEFSKAEKRAQNWIIVCRSQRFFGLWGSLLLLERVFVTVLSFNRGRNAVGLSLRWIECALHEWESIFSLSLLLAASLPLHSLD